VEIGITVVLLVAAGLLLKSFMRLRAADVGCITDKMLTLQYSLPQKKYDTPEKVNAFNEALLERVRSHARGSRCWIGKHGPGATGIGETSYSR
jgi:hypothetical protein